MAELSHTLGTIRTDAPIDTAEGSYTVGEGNKPAAVRLLQELENSLPDPPVRAGRRSAGSRR